MSSVEAELCVRVKRLEKIVLALAEAVPSRSTALDGVRLEISDLRLEVRD